MSGPFGSSQWMYASGGFYPYQIEQSLRFNDDDSAYLSRTPASAGNRKTWTWSGWVKRGALGSGQLFHAGNGSTDATWLDIGFASDRLNLSLFSTFLRTTTAVLRDPSAWYHVVVALDTTVATASDRVKVYVNGVELLQFNTSNDPALNADYAVNTTTQHNIGRSRVTSYFDGYMAEVNFIDGQALDPTSFGETKSGIWVPKAYAGSYGTNGFYLSFADSAAIGDDLSGNGNDWTANNLVSTDVLLDSPTNNYAVLNPLNQGSFVTLSDGGLKISGNTATNSAVALGTFGMTSGKWYWETTINTVAGISYAGMGIKPAQNNAEDYFIIVGATGGCGWRNSGGSGGIGGFGNTSATYPTFTTGDVIGVAADFDNGALYFSKNGSWINSGDPTSGASKTGATNVWTAGSITGFPAGGGYNGNVNTLNFGQSAFAYTPPTDFLALNTANLPDPVIDPAQDDVPADYFNTVLYTGNGSTQSITGVGFQPDFVWGKNRTTAFSHGLYDAVRGATKRLVSNGTSAEITSSTYLTSFDSDGFSLGSDGELNQSGAAQVAWNWKANGAGVSNTDGTITSTVSANQKAGFSIVSYTGTGANATVGHGLGVAPKLIIAKNRNGVYSWPVYHASYWNITNGLLFLDATGVGYSNFGYFGAAPTASVISVNTAPALNPSGQAMIAYCFAEVEGYSKFGSYTGNGSADGPFVWCGFRPAFVMVKATNITADWVIIDSNRNVYNPSGKWLLPNASSAEFNYDALYPLDFLSNGFKVRNSVGTVNTSAGTYIFAAFAENPFKYANAR